jgi:hypothetical protein
MSIKVNPKRPFWTADNHSDFYKLFTFIEENKYLSRSQTLLDTVLRQMNLIYIFVYHSL